VRLLTWRSSAQIWCELHERAFRRLGGTVKVVGLDNLKEGVLTPDIYDPTLNPLYRDVLAHYARTVGAAIVRRDDLDVLALPATIRLLILDADVGEMDLVIEVRQVVFVRPFANLIRRSIRMSASRTSGSRSRVSRSRSVQRGS
jgi:hypothetical protein